MFQPTFIEQKTVWYAYGDHCDRIAMESYQIFYAIAKIEIWLSLDWIVYEGPWHLHILTLGSKNVYLT